MTLIFYTSAKGWPPQSLKERVPNIIENWIFNDQSHKKRLSRWLRPRKPLSIQSACIYGNFEVKEAVEVIMTDGANEATEVVRFT